MYDAYFIWKIEIFAFKDQDDTNVPSWIDFTMDKMICNTFF